MTTNFLERRISNEGG
jgi:E3 ubiquitin-protein ligase MARCH5